MISLHGGVKRGDLVLEFDLEIGTGSSFVVGPNGAGKTTLLRVVAGLEALDHGALRIEDVTMDAPADGIFVATHQRPIAMAFQDHRLFPHLSVLDNVAFPARRRGRSRNDARAAARTHLAAVGLSEIAPRLPAELSIGQQQRTAIARALATPASVLLLDEPLAAIDDDSRGVIRRRLGETDHPTVVWVSHDPSDVATESSLISFDEGVIRQTRGS